MTTSVAIIGTGPAGLMAAHAARLTERCIVDVYGLGQRSVIGGAQYLHVPIQGLTSDEPDERVRFFQTGTREGYATKVYGNPEAPVSWDNYPPGHYGIWNLARAYDLLWQQWGTGVTVRTVDSEVLDRLLDEYELVVCTVPKIATCYGPSHTFHHQNVWIDYHQCPPGPNFIHYCGEGSVDWYRQSELFGWRSTEFSFEPVARKDLVCRPVKKPLKSSCDCWSDRPNLLEVGRYGRWSKTALAHEAFELTQERAYALH